MGHLERALAWLRPILLGSETWDYCVVWKLSASDISRSIEWMNCCCIGGRDGESCMNSPSREEKQGCRLLSTSLCRDSFSPHPPNKKSCLALAQLPFLIPLQSGIYGEVIDSSQPRWINLPHKLAPKAFHETIGTLVLIPVLGGLVELFAAKQILENQEIMEFVAAQINCSQDIDTIPSLNYKDVTITEDRELFLGECTNSWVDYFQQTDFKPLMSGILSGQFSNHPKLEGSSSGSIPSCLDPGCRSENSSPKQKLMVCSPLESTKQNNDQNQLKQKVELSSGCDTLVTGNTISNVSHGEDKLQVSQKEEKEKQYKSKNLIVERKRRARIKRGLCDLRALVPKISKMNQAATLDDAIEHIEEMKMKVKDLQEELEELERDECNNGIKSKPSASNGTVQFAGELDTSRQDIGSNYGKFHQIQVEVNQLTMKNLLIKILYMVKVGAFTRVLETLKYLGLQVMEVNATSCKGIASSSFVVQATIGEVQAGELRDTLIKNLCG